MIDSASSVTDELAALAGGEVSCPAAVDVERPEFIAVMRALEVRMLLEGDKDSVIALCVEIRLALTLLLTATKELVV